MQKLIEGIHQFQSESFVPLQGLFDGVYQFAFVGQENVHKGKQIEQKVTISVALSS